MKMYKYQVLFFFIRPFKKVLMFPATQKFGSSCYRVEISPQRCIQVCFFHLSKGNNFLSQRLTLNLNENFLSNCRTKQICSLPNTSTWRAKLIKFNRIKKQFFLMRCPKVMRVVMGNMEFFLYGFRRVEKMYLFNVNKYLDVICSHDVCLVRLRLDYFVFY